MWTYCVTFARHRTAFTELSILSTYKSQPRETDWLCKGGEGESWGHSLGGINKDSTQIFNI